MGAYKRIIVTNAIIVSIDVNKDIHFRCTDLGGIIMGWLTTLEGNLTKAGFNFDKGTIIYRKLLKIFHLVTQMTYLLMLYRQYILIKIIKILDKRFNCDFGAPNICQEFVADDVVKIYFPG